MNLGFNPDLCHQLIQGFVKVDHILDGIAREVIRGGTLGFWLLSRPCNYHSSIFFILLLLVLKRKRERELHTLLWHVKQGELIVKGHKVVAVIRDDGKSLGKPIFADLLKGEPMDPGLALGNQGKAIDIPKSVGEEKDVVNNKHRTRRRQTNKQANKQKIGELRNPAPVPQVAGQCGIRCKAKCWVILRTPLGL